MLISLPSLLRSGSRGLMLGLFILFSLMESVPRAFADGKRHMHLGVFAYRPVEIMEARFQPLVDYLNETLERGVVHLHVLDLDELEQAVAERRIDLILTNPSHYNLLRHRYAVQGPMVTLLKLEQGFPTRYLGGVILARHDSEIEQLLDLKGQQVGVPGLYFLGGFQAQAHELLRRGMDLKRDLELIELGNHDAVMQALVEGTLSAGFVRTGILEEWQREGYVDGNTLRVLNEQTYAGFPFSISTQLYPEWPLAPVSECECARELVRALLNLTPDHPAVVTLGIAGFTVPADYSVMDRLALALKLPPYDQIPEVNLATLWKEYGIWLTLLMLLALLAGALSLALLRFNTGLRRANTHVEQLLDRFQKLAAHLPGMLYQYRQWPDGRSAFPYASEGIRRIYGVSPEEVREDASAVYAVIHRADLPNVASSIQHSMEAMEPWHLEYRAKPQGRLIWLEGRATPQRLEDGSILWHGYITEITQRVRLEEERRQQTEAVQASNAELEQFTYVVSHDLRQPLRMINSYLQLLARRLGPELSGENEKMLNFAVDGGQRLDQMLLSLLEYSRVGRKGQPREWMNIHRAIDEALRFLAPEVAEQQARIDVQGSDWPEVSASPDEMTRLFQNLIGNAIKYHHPQQAPVVRIGVERLRGHWRFYIEDEGIGIDPEQSDRLFKMFQRLHSRNQYEGTGVGLAVCRKIVERHGGKIWQETGTDGVGSRFCFTLPLADAADAQP